MQNFVIWIRCLFKKGDVYKDIAEDVKKRF